MNQLWLIPLVASNFFRYTLGATAASGIGILRAASFRCRSIRLCQKRSSFEEAAVTAHPSKPTQSISRGSRLGIRLGREELNLMLRRQCHHFRGISKPVDFFKKGLQFASR